MIKIYGIPFCNLCDIAINQLDELGISYEYLSIDSLDKDEFNYLMVNKKGQSAPLIFINGDEISHEEFNEFIEQTKNSIIHKTDDWGVLDSTKVYKKR